MRASAPFVDLVPMLMCDDVQASVRFYTGVLGFEVTGRMDDVGRSGFASIKNGAAAIMLASPDYIPEAPKVDRRYPQSNYYFHVADAEALRQSVVEAGWDATECVHRFYDIREFEVVDPDGARPDGRDRECLRILPASFEMQPKCQHPACSRNLARALTGAIENACAFSRLRSKCNPSVNIRRAQGIWRAP